MIFIYLGGINWEQIMANYTQQNINFYEVLFLSCCFHIQKEEKNIMRVFNTQYKISLPYANEFINYLI